MSSDRQQVPAQTQNVHIFGATSFLNDTASEMAYWILPAFLTTIGAGPATLGIIEGIAESVASLAKLFSGLWTDRLRRRKPLVVSGYVVANAVKPLLAFVGAAWQVLGIRFADRLAKGVRGTPRDVMLAESVPPEKVGGAFGLLQAMDSAGAIAGPLIAMAIMGSIWGQTYGPRAVFLAAGIPGALCVLVVALGLRETPHVPSAPRKKIFGDGGRLPAAYIYVVFAVTLFSIGNSSDMFLVLRAQSIGIPAMHAPLLGLVFNIVYTAASWPAGRISDRASGTGLSFWRYGTAATGLLIFTGVYLVFAFAPSRMSLYAAMAFYGLYYALTQPVMKAIVVDTVPRESRGRAFGVFYFLTSVAALLASIVTGALWKRFGPEMPFLVSASLAAISALMLVLTPKLFRLKSA